MPEIPLLRAVPVDPAPPKPKRPECWCAVWRNINLSDCNVSSHSTEELARKELKLAIDTNDGGRIGFAIVHIPGEP